MRSWIALRDHRLVPCSYSGVVFHLTKYNIVKVYRLRKRVGEGKSGSSGGSKMTTLGNREVSSKLKLKVGQHLIKCDCAIPIDSLG